MAINVRILTVQVVSDKNHYQEPFIASFHIETKEGHEYDDFQD